MADSAAPKIPDPVVAPADPAERKRLLREGLWVWGVSFVVLMVARYLVGPAVPWVANNLKALAIVLFLYLPFWLVNRRGEYLADYGLTLKHWKQDVWLALKLSMVIFPVFILAFWGFVMVLIHVPEPWRSELAPYTQGLDLGLRLPPHFLLLVLTHFLVVALPEEFFYRGFIYARLAAGFDELKRARWIFGIPVGPAFWLTAVLFALGHLTEPYPWRLAVFFPALVFMWLRLKTGTVIGDTVFHALSNLTVAVLEACFFGHLGH